MPRRDQIEYTRRRSLWLYGVLSVMILIAGYVSYSSYETSLRAGVGAQFEAIVSLKATEVSSWRAERISDGEMLRDTPGFPELVRRAVDGPDADAARADLATWFDTISATSGYLQVSLLDADGARILTSPETTSAPDAALRRQAEQVMRTGEVGIADFHRDNPDAAQIHLSVVVPVVDGKGTGEPIGAVALVVDPDEFLFPYIRQWPGDAETGETLLVERDGSDVLFLNELKYQKNAALRLRIPLTRTEVPAVRAVTGYEGSLEGVDYRGVPVVAATMSVPDSPWAVVARADASEVYAPLRTRMRVTVLVIASALLAGLMSILLVLRVQAARLDRAQWALESERSWLSGAVDGSLNEVYVFDVDSRRFEYLNHGALMNIGYTMEELAEMTPTDLQPEFTEEEFEAMLAPLVNGEEGMLVFETRNRRKDGSEYPIVVRLQLTERGERRLFIAFINDITERRKVEAELARHRQHLELLVSERTQKLQDTIEELASANEELQALYEELAATNEELSAANEELAATNEELEVSNRETQSLYAAAAETSQELERLNGELAQADSAKNDFLASMSHELRTPLNSVIGFSDIMLQGLAGALNEEQQRQMDMINSSGKHLLLLINDVLDLSKIEAGRMEPEYERFDIADDAREVLEALRPQARDRELALSASGVTEPIDVVSDSRMVRQILFNLLNNAIKFTDEGAVRMDVSQHGDVVEISVNDTGPGIHESDQRRIFDAFTQVGVSNYRPDGTGLGLTVSSRLAALLGGTLTVESERGKGSTFILTLPREPHPGNGV